MTRFIAHRGESFIAPENTIAAIKLAWNNNADGVEIDVRLSKDNKIVVIHDSDTKRTSGISGKVKFLTLDSIKKLDVGIWKGKKWLNERIPTLEKVLENVPPGKFVMIEIKCSIAILPLLRKLLHKTSIRNSQIKLAGFGLRKMAEIKKAMPQFEVFRIKRVDRENIILNSYRISRLIKSAKKNNLDGVSLSYSGWLSKKKIGKIQSSGLKVFVWTVDNPRRALRLMNSGTDGIISNKPTWLKENIKARQPGL
ncbi:MAG: glycerophosphodiester phosphodiesterase family protein [Ignavibacteriaceae bacterium]|nr:glycerophosphodiester phosphodiesterase family protein [Ignavibacteriaceae bacterium]